MAANRKDNTAAGMPVNRVQDIRERLLSLAEEDYREFNMKLLPGVERVMGVFARWQSRLQRAISGRILTRRRKRLQQILFMRRSWRRD